MSENRRVTNPFPGLRPFETNEYLLFFGREGQSDALVARLERARFLAVVGTSGSGKSSLVRAGLLPALRGGMMSGAGADWRVAIMRPGHDPIGNLARALSDAADEKRREKEKKETEAERKKREERESLETEGEKRKRLEERRKKEEAEGLRRAEAEAVIEATLRRGSLGLVETAASARMGEREKLLVVADQFEELFRFRAARAGAAATDDDAAAFVKLLLEAARQREVPVYVVLTMRSDFLGDCAQFQGLPEAINDGQYLIPRMTRDERRFAIVGPARVARGKMSEPLVNRLLNDVGDNPDQLPILQHALMRTWDYWLKHRGDSEPVGLEHYLAVGTMSDALSEHADEAYNELPDERSRRLAELLFKALTERGADNREVRRPTRLDEICEIAEATPEEVAAVVEVFRRQGRSFLMPPAGVALTPDTVIDISHESLIRNWVRLRDWVKDEAEGARIYRRLADAAAAHRAGEGGLLDDVTLGWVNRWRERYRPNRAWGVRYHAGYDEAMEYLEESRAARAAEAEERERQRRAEIERARREREQAEAFAQQQRRAARRMRWLAAGMAVMFILALAGGVRAYRMGEAARRSADEAQRAREKAEAERVNAENSAREAKAAQAKAEMSSELAQRLVESLRQEREKTDAAAAATRRALEAQKKATALALRQTALARAAEKTARDAEETAKVAKDAALKNAKRREMAAERSALHLLGIASLQRQDYVKAIDQLGAALQDLDEEEQLSRAENGAKSSPAGGTDATLLKYARGSVLTHAGEALRKANRYVKAKNAYEEAVKRQQEVVEHFGKVEANSPANADMKLALFDAVHGLAHAYRDLAAEAEAQSGKAGAQPSPTPDADSDVDPHDAADAARKDYAQSEKYFKEALKIQQDVYKDAPPSALAASYENLARLYRDLGRFDDAEPLYRQIVELRRKDSPNGDETMSALKELAQFYAGQNSKAGYEKALDAYKQLLAAQEGLGGDSEFPAWADTYSEMGEVYLGLGDEAHSETSFRLARLLQGVGLKLKQINRAGNLPAAGGRQRVLEMFRRSNAGKDMEEAADLFAQLGNHEKAVEFYRMLAVTKQESGDANGVAELLLKMAKVQREQLKDNEAALDSYKTAEAFLRESPQAASPALLAEALTRRGQLLAEQLNKPAEAEQVFKGALDVLAKAPGAAREKYSTLSELAALYKRLGRVGECADANRKKLEAAAAMLDENSPDSPAQKRWDGAAYTEAFGLYIHAVSDLADSLVAWGKPDEARETLRSLLDQRLNPSHALDAAVLDTYVRMLEIHKGVLAADTTSGAHLNATNAVGERIRDSQERKAEIEQITRRPQRARQ